MKNIHVIPTSAASRLFIDIDNGKLALTDNPIKGDYMMNRHIYITSGEEIKKDNWCIDEDENITKADETFIFNCSHEFTKFWKKIVLTTNENLIKNSVQAIDDEFLEWFVKNPSCEEVKLVNHVLEVGYNLYKIIIPKEESKQSVEEYAQQGLEKYSYKLESKQELHVCKYCGAETTQPDDECYAKPKQETLEEAVEKEIKFLSPFQDDSLYRQAFVDGAKWQAERMYSEEEVLNLLTFINDRLPDLYSRFSPEEELDEYLKTKKTS